MGRNTGPVCRLCRREGTKLFLKGTRCDTPKCAVDRREGVPGMHQYRRGKASEYAVRLREKQKVKRYYGIFERQFRKYYAEANRRAGNTGDALMSLLDAGSTTWSPAWASPPAGPRPGRSSATDIS